MIAPPSLDRVTRTRRAWCDAVLNLSDHYRDCPACPPCTSLIARCPVGVEAARLERAAWNAYAEAAGGTR